MKKNLIFCIALVALMTSCVKEPSILRRLTTEEANAIPYHKGQTVSFLNENGDTLSFVVTYDETKHFSEDYWEYPYGSKMSIIRRPWCYARTVQLYSHSDSIHPLMMFTVVPDNPRALDSESLAAVFTEKGIAAESFDVLDDGVKAAYSYAKSNDVPLIALGSLYMYRQFTESLRRI